MSLILSHVCVADIANCISSTGTWVLALSCCIHIVLLPLSSLGHFALIAGSTSEIK
jgi:hypothetical protein